MQSAFVEVSIGSHLIRRYIKLLYPARDSRITYVAPRTRNCRLFSKIQIDATIELDSLAYRIQMLLGYARIDLTPAGSTSLPYNITRRTPQLHYTTRRIAVAPLRPWFECIARQMDIVLPRIWMIFCTRACIIIVALREI